MTARSLLGPLKLAPIPVQRPWGGFALCQRFGKPLPNGGGPLGESWEASDLRGSISRVLTPPFIDTPLTMLFQEPLPLLIKLIDAREWLSLQVHPDEAAARALQRARGGDATVRPKTEAWHILWAEPGAEIIYGVREGVSTAQLLEACAAGEVSPLLRRVRVHVGDTIFVPAGTVHAIGPGIVLYEVQQPSDETYRLYDWGRVGLDGAPRKLHLEEAARAIRPTPKEHPCRSTALTEGPNPRIGLLRSEHFRLDLMLVDRGDLVVFERPTMSFLTVTAGAGRLLSDAARFDLRTGDTVLVPAEVDYCLLPGDRGMRVLRSAPMARGKRASGR